MNPYRTAPNVRPFALPRWLQGCIGATCMLLSVFTVIGAITVTTASCKALPTVENVAQVVIADFLEGKSQQQIEADACNALGGTSLEDVACKDVSALVVDIIESAIAKGQLSGDARARAEAYRAAHASPPAASSAGSK